MSDETPIDPVVDALRTAVRAAEAEQHDAERRRDMHQAGVDEWSIRAAQAADRAARCDDFLQRMQAGELDTGGMVQEMQTPPEGRGETCPHHVLVQHRDGLPPWCGTCGRVASGQHASSLKQRPSTGQLQALTGMQTRVGPSDWSGLAAREQGGEE